MIIKLLNKETLNQMIYYAVLSARNCYDSTHLMDSTETTIGEKDWNLLERLAKSKHSTIFENIHLYWDIDKVSRSLLNEHSRHRIVSGTGVKSTRYTLGKMIKKFKANYDSNARYNHYVIDKELILEYFMNIEGIDWIVNNTFKYLMENDMLDLPNDKMKLYFPESLFTKINVCYNLRSFVNFYNLRSAPQAHFEIRELANTMYNELPDNIKKLVDILKGD